MPKKACLHIVYIPYGFSTNTKENNLKETAMGNKMASTRNKKKEDGKFRSKHITHDPQAESARAVFGKQNGNEDH